MRRFLIPAVLTLMAGCDAGSAPLGEPILQVVSGDGQTAPAAAQDTLGEPVRARLGRQPAEGIANRLGLVRNLYAQTIVQGIAGEQVCSEGIGEAPLVAWNKCDITDANGHAEFFFDPGTVVTDSSCAEVRAVVDGQKVVTDVVCVRVEPGPIVVPSGWRASAVNDAADAEEVAEFWSSAFKDAHGNVNSSYRVEGTGWLETVGDTVGTKAGRSLRKIADVAMGDTTTVRFYDASGALLVDAVAELGPGTANGVMTWALNVTRRSNY